MLQKIKRLFLIKTRFEAYAVIYALALGAVERGTAYLGKYPGIEGKLLFLACTCSVFMGGAKILDCIRHETAAKKVPAKASNDNDEIVIAGKGKKRKRA